MKTCFLSLLISVSFLVKAQTNAAYNTAGECLYMMPNEKEMIYEINRVRNDPKSYIQYLVPLLKKAALLLKVNGKGERNYSLTISSTSADGTNLGSIDTTWHYTNQEEVKALTTLINDLKKLKRLSILQPDTGIYKAAKKHALDEQAHDWKLLHTGSDGSNPLDRILLFSPLMVYGNENIAGRTGYGELNSRPRDFVLQLLIDSGIPGYGHRYNMLDPQWTHVGCSLEKFKGGYWCIQDFGYRKKINNERPATLRKSAE